MKIIFKIVLFLFVFISFSISSIADTLDFDNVNEDDLKKIIGDFSGNFSHTTISGASSLGTTFGFELGLVLGASTTPGIDELTKEQDPNAQNAGLVHGGLLLQVSVPMGITIEANMIPSIDASDLEFSNTGLGVKWTLTQTLLSLPVDLALKANMTKTDLSFSTVIQNASTSNIPVNSKMELSSTTTGLMAFVSKKLLVFEPYFGLGIANTSGDLKVTGSGTIFDQTLTTGQSSDASTSGMQFALGSEINLFVVKFGIEYSKVIDTTRYSGKFSFYF